MKIFYFLLKSGEKYDLLSLKEVLKYNSIYYIFGHLFNRGKGPGRPQCLGPEHQNVAPPASTSELARTRFLQAFEAMGDTGTGAKG